MKGLGEELGEFKHTVVVPVRTELTGGVIGIRHGPVVILGKNADLVVGLLHTGGSAKFAMHGVRASVEVA